MKIFEKNILIRFAHCDPAGIVFHPQYFVIFNGVVEDFFREELGVSFDDMVKSDLGLPVAGIHCDLTAPSRVGDECIARLWVERLGEKSVRLAMTLHAKDELRLQMVETLVCVGRARSQGPLRSLPIPSEMAQKFREYLADPSAIKPLELRA